MGYVWAALQWLQPVLHEDGVQGQLGMEDQDWGAAVPALGLALLWVGCPWGVAGVLLEHVCRQQTESILLPCEQSRTKSDTDIGSNLVLCGNLILSWHVDCLLFICGCCPKGCEVREAVFSFLKKMTENKFRRTPKNNAGFVIHQAASQRGKSGAGFFEGLNKWWHWMWWNFILLFWIVKVIHKVRSSSSCTQRTLEGMLSWAAVCHWASVKYLFK